VLNLAIRAIDAQIDRLGSRKLGLLPQGRTTFRHIPFRSYGQFMLHGSAKGTIGKLTVLADGRETGFDL
jgi:hypothetical protein